MRTYHIHFGYQGQREMAKPDVSGKRQIKIHGLGQGRIFLDIDTTLDLEDAIYAVEKHLSDEYGYVNPAVFSWKQVRTTKKKGE